MPLERDQSGISHLGPRLGASTEREPFMEAEIADLLQLLQVLTEGRIAHLEGITNDREVSGAQTREHSADAEPHNTMDGFIEARNGA